MSVADETFQSERFKSTKEAQSANISSIVFEDEPCQPERSIETRDEQPLNIQFI